MLKVIDPQLDFAEQDIGAIHLDPKSRDDIPQILRGLQYLYTTPQLRERVFAILSHLVFNNGSNWNVPRVPTPDDQDNLRKPETSNCANQTPAPSQQTKDPRPAAMSHNRALPAPMLSGSYGSIPVAQEIRKLPFSEIFRPMSGNRSIAEVVGSNL